MNLEPLPDHEERIELVDTVKVVEIIDDDSELSYNHVSVMIQSVIYRD